MSFDKKGRKIRPESGKSVHRLAGTIEKADSNSFTAAIAHAFHESFGGTGVSIKTVMAYTGAGKRTVKNWFEGKNAPNGKFYRAGSSLRRDPRDGTAASR